MQMKMSSEVPITVNSAALSRLEEKQLIDSDKITADGIDVSNEQRKNSHWKVTDILPSKIDQTNCAEHNDEVKDLSLNCTKSSSVLNFSVDRILNSRCQSDSFQSSRSVDFPLKHPEIGSNSKSKTSDCNSNKLIRPMPMRYAPNTLSLPGFPLPSQVPRYHFKYPIANFNHHAHHHPASAGYASNYGVEKLMTPHSMPFSHLQHTHHRPIDVSDTKIGVHLSSPSIGVNPSSAAGGMHQNSPKRKRSWSRAVFSQLQRKGLEIQFQIQKYITKPDRRKLAARLGLTDAQVKVWFQNRRMKWRHSRETKLEKNNAAHRNHRAGLMGNGCDEERDECMSGDGSSSSIDSSCSSSDDGDNEIDVVAE